MNKISKKKNDISDSLIILPIIQPYRKSYTKQNFPRHCVLLLHWYTLTSSILLPQYIAYYLLS